MTTNNSWNAPFPSTKGDMIVGDGSGQPSILPLGTDTYILMADSSQSTGVKWTSSDFLNAPIYNVSGSLNNSQITSLFTTPVTIISAPGANKVIFIMFSMLKYTYNGAPAYTGGGTVNFIYNGGSTNLTTGGTSLTSGEVTGTTSIIKYLDAGKQLILVSEAQNKALNIRAQTANFSGTNSNTIEYNVYYKILDM